MAALNAFARAYWDMPPITRMYMSASVATTLAVQLEIISPFQLYFNPKLIFGVHQYWRLITTFLFFGPLGFNFLFNLVFTYRYCRMLEEGFFRNRTADFFYMFLVGGALMTIFGYFVNLLFLGHAFTIMLVYVWSRRNPGLRMNFFGLITFQAPYLPWVLLIFTILLGSSTVVDTIGIIVGHFYYFFEDVFPNEPHGFRILETPRLIKIAFERLGLDERTPQEDEATQDPVAAPDAATAATAAAAPEPRNDTHRPAEQEEPLIDDTRQPGPSAEPENNGESSVPAESRPSTSQYEQEQELRNRNITRPSVQ